MHHGLLVLLPILHATLLAQDLPTMEEVQAQLAQHRKAVCGDQPTVASFACTGTIEIGKSRSAVRLFVRRAPFCCRREIEPQEPPGPTVITITDGRLAWDGAGRPLAADLTLTCLEDAFVDGLLYLDPKHVAGLPDSREPVQQPDYPGLPADVPRGLRTHLLGLQSPAGSMLQVHLDLDGKALREVVSIVPGLVRWIRFGGEQRFPALVVPMVRASGRLGAPDVEVRRWTEVNVTPSLPTELFAHSPSPVTPSLQKAGRFEVVAHTLPGSVHIALPVVTLNGRYPVRAVFDTGCTDLCVAPELAAAVRLPLRSPMEFQGFGKKSEHPTAWLDALALGNRQLLQLRVPVVAPTIDNSSPLDRQDGVLIGLQTFLESPVLDFATGELVCRGTPVTPLASMGAGGRVMTVPLRQRDTLLYYVTIEVNGTKVEALLDTGTPMLLRLSRTVLQRCGLPTAPETWIAAGGARVAAGGVGGERWRDVVAQLDAFKLGDVTFEKPLVIFGGLDDDKPQVHDAIIGAGALLAFARVGFDLQRGCLELDPGDRLLASNVVPPAGEYLGLGLASPAGALPARILPLPTITEIAAGSAAARAGLAPTDRVWSIGGNPCAGLSAGAVNRRFWLRPGEHVEFEVLARDGTRRTVRLP